MGLGAEDDDGNKASKKKEMPTRTSVNGELLEMETIEAFNEYAKRFQMRHTKAVWNQLSGKRGNKTETWKNVFDTQKARINGENPVNANEHPDDLQKRFDTMVDTCQDRATYVFCQKMYEDNKALKITKNFEALDKLNAFLEERLGDR